MAVAEGLVNALTIDVEDFFQVAAFEAHLERSRWLAIDSRVEANTDRILALLECHRTRATFFVLGWIACRHPGLVRRIVAGGHELASHGFDHVRATRQDPVTFLADVTATRHFLEEVGQVPVVGYRAATYSIGRDNLWALERLRRAGYLYSSSIYPIRHDLYGMPEAPPTPFRPHPGGVVELPVATVTVGGQRIPCGGGGYFRLFPYAFSRWALRRLNHREGRPAIFYCHPWELDPDQPRLPHIGLRSRFRHYLNLHRMEDRLSALLRDFRWGPIVQVFRDVIPGAEAPRP
ncbi:MAG: DUF3473 domain-containing protein [Magnetococcales bacterium]|nr:DUF3473 domain-containing protein [Magnetococcales bacterium]